MKRAVRDAWVMGGSKDPRGARAFGFGEQEVAFAAVEAFYSALERCPQGDRHALVEALKGEFGRSVCDLAAM